MCFYAWIIDKEQSDDGIGNLKPSTRRTIGPRSASENLLARLKAGEGRPFRMLDDDDELIVEGRIISSDPSDDMGEEYFGPLEDFGEPNAGCTSIQYQNPVTKEWETL